MAVSEKLQIRMTTQDAVVYTGPNGLMIMDTGYTSIRIHDGVTEGGNLLLSAKGNLRELTNPAAARAALQLGSAALLDADEGFMVGANNLSEVADQDASRLNIVAAKSGANTDITSVLLNDQGLTQKNVAGDFKTKLSFGGAITADRKLTITAPDADKTLTLADNATISGVNTGDQATNLIGDVTSEISGTDVVVTLNDVVDGAVADNAELTINDKGLVTGIAERAQSFPVNNKNGLIDWPGGITEQFYNVLVDADSGAAYLQTTINMLREFPKANLITLQLTATQGIYPPDKGLTYSLASISTSFGSTISSVGVVAKRADASNMAYSVEFWLRVVHKT